MHWTSDSKLDALGRRMHDLAARLFPICRGLAGPGVRQTLAVLAEHVPLEVREVPTGTKVFDWEVPREWYVRDAFIKDDAGQRLVDFRRSNLHVFAGSQPVRAKMPWRDLEPHLVSLPEHPTWIPYRRTFHHEAWGFCVTHEQLLEFQRRGDRQYDVAIDAVLNDGSLSYGELLLPGETDDEVLISTHVCHPSLANDNLSGIVVATCLGEHLLGLQKRRYSYRLLFLPGTIGAITWLALNEAQAGRIKHGLVLSVLGDPGPSTYRRSRQGNAEIDRAMAHVLAQSGSEHAVLDFEPLGYDQRQFCSPGFDLPVGCLMRTPDGQYPEYHTSADNLDLIRPWSLADSWAKCAAAFDVLENNRTYRNLKPKCEPRLDKTGLPQAFAAEPDPDRAYRAAAWLLNLSDGSHSLLDIAERSGLNFTALDGTARLAVEHGLLAEVPGDGRRCPAAPGTESVCHPTPPAKTSP